MNRDRLLILSALLAGAGCREQIPDLVEPSEPPPASRLEIVVQQAGLYLDNGFVVVVDNVDRHAIRPDPTSTWGANPQRLVLPIPAGQHTVALEGVASNCADNQGVIPVVVPSDGVGLASFNVTCHLTERFLGRSLAFVRAAPGGVWEFVVIGGTTAARVMGLPAGHAVHGKPTWSPDGSRLAVVTEVSNPSGQLEHRLTIVRTDGGTPTVISQDPFAVAWSPSGGAIAFTKLVEVAGTGGLWVAEEEEGWAARRLWDGWGQAVHNPAWSPDGQAVAVASDWKIVLVSREGDVLRNLHVGGWEPHNPAWSPDGQRLAYLRWYDSEAYSGTKLSVMELATGADITVAAPGLAIRDLAWLPDGSGFLVESSYRRDQNNPVPHRCISVVLLGEEEVRPLMSCATSAYGVAVSPR